MPRLLVSVVNYCDPEFYSTVKSLWDNAATKEALFFSLVSEDLIEHDFNFIPKNQILYRHYDVSKYRGGVSWARNLAVNVDVEYDYLIQFDSHTLASYGWDKAAINTYCYIDDTKYLIAYAPADYELNVDGTPELNNVPRPYSSKATSYKDFIPGFNFPGYDRVPNIGPTRSFWATCCYLLAPFDWVKEVGINGYSSFNTEEISLSLRTFAKGWKIYAIQSRDVFHHDSHKQPSGEVTRSVNRPWADDRREDYWAHVESATDSLGMLMAGLGDVPLEAIRAFFESTGIDERYMDYKTGYSSHVVIPNRALGMPPRRT